VKEGSIQIPLGIKIKISPSIHTAKGYLKGMKESRRVPIFQRGKKNPPENYKNLSLIIMEHNHEQNYETFGTLQQTHIFFETIGFNAVQYFYQKQNYLLVDGVFVRDMSQ
jgi:hypothetical protein